MTACARPGNLDDLDLRGTIRMLEQAVFQRDALLDRAAHVLDLVLREDGHRITATSERVMREVWVEIGQVRSNAGIHRAAEGRPVE